MSFYIFCKKASVIINSLCDKDGTVSVDKIKYFNELINVRNNGCSCYLSTVMETIIFSIVSDKEDDIGIYISYGNRYRVSPRKFMWGDQDKDVWIAVKELITYKEILDDSIELDELTFLISHKGSDFCKLFDQFTLNYFQINEFYETLDILVSILEVYDKEYLYV